MVLLYVVKLLLASGPVGLFGLLSSEELKMQNIKVTADTKEVVLRLSFMFKFVCLFVCCFL